MLVLLAIELLDELVGGSRAAAWPLIRHDLGLSYAEIGLLLALPGLFGSALDPLIGLAGDTRRRGMLMAAGGFVFTASAVLSAAAVGFWTLLVALLIGNPATGSFVSLAQATLMDREPARRERNMARWTVAGSIGYVAGPALIAAGVALGLGWRGVLAAARGRRGAAGARRPLAPWASDRRRARRSAASSARCATVRCCAGSRCSRRPTCWATSSTASSRSTSSTSRARGRSRRLSPWRSGPAGPSSETSRCCRSCAA